MRDVHIFSSSISSHSYSKSCLFLFFAIRGVSGLWRLSLLTSNISSVPFALCWMAVFALVVPIPQCNPQVSSRSTAFSPLILFQTVLPCVSLSLFLFISDRALFSSPSFSCLWQVNSLLGLQVSSSHGFCLFILFVVVLDVFLLHCCCADLMFLSIFSPWSAGSASATTPSCT